MFLLPWLQQVSHRWQLKDKLMAMAAEPVPDAVWDERQAYEELLYWDSLIQRGHRLLPHDFDRYCIAPG